MTYIFNLPGRRITVTGAASRDEAREAVNDYQRKMYK